MTAARIAVLVPVRNGERDLPGFLECVGGFADLVLALDDGSTDSTRDILESSPIVAKILSNPRRETYAGWDDAENRRRLLRELDDLEADWVLFLDADERLDEADGAALRQFAATEASPGFAYGFLVVQMVGGADAYDADSALWVYRMFAHERGLELPSRRLHFVPVPVSIPRARRVRTTLRIQHLGGLDDERRDARFQKYREADPDRAYQADYGNLLARPANIRAWKPRSPITPVVVDRETRYAALAADADRELDRPALSAVVISQDDEATIAASVQAIVSQQVDQPFEVVVVTSGSDGTADVVAAGFPSVRVVRLPRPALPGEARNAGLWVARGHYVTFPGSHVVIAPGSLEARMAAHDAGWDLVTGATSNGNHTRPGWASYFLDHSANLPGRASGELWAAPAHCSYVRRDLDFIGGFPEDLRAGEDTVVNQLLFRRGRRAFHAEDVSFLHSSPCRTPASLVRHHFGRGRAWGRIQLERAGSRRRLVRRRGRRLLAQPWHRVRTVSRNVRLWAGPLRADYRASRHLIVAAALASSFGTWYQVLRGDPAKPSRPTRRQTSPEDRTDADPVLVAHYGSPAAVDLGILGFGPRQKAARRVLGHALRQPRGAATPALYLLSVAATSTPGWNETFSSSLSPERVESYRAAAQSVGARLIIGIQASRQSFRDALAPFEEILREPGVGVGLQPAWSQPADDPDREVGRAPWPRADLEDALRWISDVTSAAPPTIVLIHSTPDVTWPGDWAPADLPGLDVIGLAERIGTLGEKKDAFDTMAARAPAAGLQFDFRSDPEILEPAELRQLCPASRIVVYR
jgi:glycosyltransferase involved in cell wall biosynthesis